MSDVVDEKREAYLRNMVGLLTEADLMAMLGVSDHTTQGWRFYGSGPAYVKLGKRIYYRVQDVRAWIDNNVRVRTGGGGAGKEIEDDSESVEGAEVEAA